MVVGGTQYQDGVNLIVALQQLDYQPKLAAFSTAPTNPEFAAAIGDKTEGILSPTGYTTEAAYPTNNEFVEKYTAQFRQPAGGGRGQRLHHRPGRRRRRRRPSGAPSRATASSSSSTGCAPTRSTPSSAR